jgi:hypothetical protein
MNGIAPRASAASRRRIGRNATASSLVRRWGTRAGTAGLWVLAVLAGPLGGGKATAQPIQWADVTACYERGVHEQKPIVILLYDKVTSRLDADVVATRLSLSPRIQAVASKAAWCFGDVSSDIVSRNIGKALQVNYYPSVSVLAPEANMLDEAARIVGMSARLDGSGFEEAAEKYIVLQIEKLSAKYGGSR